MLAGINNNNKLLVGNFTTDEIKGKNFKWAIEAGPVLIVNGEKPKITATAGGIAPRTAIGQTKEGTILLLVIDGRQVTSVGASLYNAQSVLFEYGAINAMNLDGGTSSSMFYDGKLINKPCKGNEQRNLPNAIIIK
jgi:exopolysaccharide biosynthesis protein